jgi:hypothetical protein
MRRRTREEHRQLPHTARQLKHDLLVPPLMLP